MSLAASAGFSSTGGVGGIPFAPVAVAAPQPQFGTSSSSFGAASSELGPAGILGPTQGAGGGSSSRGELSGDLCSTIDFFADGGIKAAIWMELACQPLVIRKPSLMQLPLIKLSGDIEQLSNSYASIADLYRSMIAIGNHSIAPDYDRSEPCFNLSPLQALATVQQPKDAMSVNAVALLLQYALNQVLAETDALLTENTDAAAVKKKGKKSKKATRKRITLICPCWYYQQQLMALQHAAYLADISIKNVFNRGVAATVGALFSSKAAADQLLRVNKQKPSAATKAPQSLVNQAAFFKQLMQQTKEEAIGGEPLILYLNVCKQHSSEVVNEEGTATSKVSCFYFDAALIRLEGAKEAQQLGTIMRFGRVCTAAATGGALIVAAERTNAAAVDDITESAEVLKQLRDAVSRLFAIDSSDSAPAAVLLDGMLATAAADKKSLWADSSKVKQSFLRDVSATAATAAKDIIVHCCEASSAALGGAILSAAELESSKYYLQTDDGWKLAHQWPVADSIVLGGAVGVAVQWDETSPPLSSLTAATTAAAALVEPLGENGARVWKELTGPMEVGKNASALAIKKEFTWGKGENGRKIKAKLGWPKVHILQQQAVESGETDGASSDPSKKEYRWRIVKTITPLATSATESREERSNADSSSGGGDDQKFKQQSVVSCTLNICVDPATGTVTVTHSAGQTVADSWHSWWSYLVLAFMILFPFLLIGGVRLYEVGHARYVDWQQESWLTDFYQKNAPEKLVDPSYVRRALKKYDGKMFILWRNLERTYNVKWPPPRSIIEDNQ